MLRVLDNSKLNVVGYLSEMILKYFIASYALAKSTLIALRFQKQAVIGKLVMHCSTLKSSITILLTAGCQYSNPCNLTVTNATNNELL